MINEQIMNDRCSGK